MSTRDLVLIALFAAITAAMGLMPPISVGFLPVPITLQTLGVMLAGLMLGPVRGGLALALLVLLVAIGLPVLAGGRGGFGVLLGPTGGFIVGWIVGAFVTGLVAQRTTRVGSWGARDLAFALLACLAGGVVAVYAIGIPWLAVVTGMDLVQAAAGSAVFLPGDAVKAIVAVLVARGVQRAYPMKLR
ncbi:biotin transporter BioY [Salinarimonas ramus]|uniref:Biotin transporter n=1 Tax=Salinarimonas ramus TaxID=690164 RepID=A0A917V2B3_9HYPH|nr:biotin transporter BioY [Salinarimonas ramus]GGK21667.1 BioY family transporter [Salinarimonas ramus]